MLCDRAFSWSKLMDMSSNALNLFEALVKFAPSADRDDALAVARTIESSVHHGQKHIEKNILDKVMTREDGERLKQQVNQLDQKVNQLDQKVDKLNDKLTAQIKWYISAMFVAVAAATAAANWLH
ncbi:MAG: hypothetical protein LBH10_03975 [Burkholderiaceae bacterium]|jgi:uncharacterized protein YlxW (UPF0749 family)|nr:hypothetical protein [Burkholderiaceae bacterium]